MRNLFNRISVATVVFYLLLFSPTSEALTANQFAKLCETSQVACSKNQIVQAYVGGALDLLATLNERTDYLAPIYCKEPREIFDIEKIVEYMQKHGAQYAESNAMLVMVRYFEKEGGCEK